MKRTLLFITAMLASHTMIAQEEQTDYIPFVEMGKQWHVVSSVTSPTPNYQLMKYWMNDSEERSGKTYYHVWNSTDALTDIYDIGLFREENRRVYKYDETSGRDIMIYDFSLKEGDTFSYETEPGHPVNCKVLKQGLLTEGPKILSNKALTSADTLDTQYRRLRTWTIGCDNGTGEYHELTTWVEGAGTLCNMFSQFYSGGVQHLSYIERTDPRTDYRENDYLPFSFYNIWGSVHGCNLPTGAVTNWEDYNHQLTYELEGNSLHVYGSAFTNCGRNNYAFFHEEKTDDPLVHRIKFQIQAVEPVTTCMALHATNFYVPGFDPNMNYIVVDDQGVEHPVINKTPQMAYRPFAEEGKVWKVGSTLIRDNLVKMVEYYYFDGDTIINNKTFKRMMCQRYVNPEYPDYTIVMHYPLLRYVGAWYEEDQKVYFATNNQVKLLYDFSLNANDTIVISGNSYVVGPKKTGGIKGFKGVYRDILMVNYNTTWLEGVGGIDGPTVSVYSGEENHAIFLMSCTVGDELIYFNDDYEDGATPESAEARKRIDFTHTIKIKPKSRRTIDVESLLYGEYNDLQLGINLNALDDAYLVHIADETGKTVYEKTVNAGNVVGLNIDISTYPKGRYTITVENSSETFTGRFETQPNGIEEVRSKSLETRGAIYNLQGQRLDTLQKGLNIVNGKKVIAK